MDKKISIIIPIYGVEQYLKKCVDCLVNQTYKNLEIILVDDGSPDNCGQICDELALTDDRIVVIHKENGGVSSARNLGIEKATGDYISFIDPDDVIPKDYYSILYNNISDADCSLCKFEEFCDSISFNTSKDYDIKTLNKVEAVSLGIYKHAEVFYVVWNKLIKSSIVKQFRFDETMKNGEDSVFAFDVIMACDKVVYIDLPLYGYYMRADGAVKQMDATGMMNIIKMAEHIFAPMKDMLDKKAYSMARNVYIYTIVITFAKLKKIGAKDKLKDLKRIIFRYTFAIIKTDNLTVKEKAYLLLTYWM